MGFDLKGAGDLLDHVNGNRRLGGFELTEPGAVDTCLLGKHLLETSLSSETLPVLNNP